VVHKTNADPSVDELIDQLSDPNMWIRAKAAYELSDCYDSRAVDPLIPLLRDPKPRVRANAAYALHHLEARHIGEELLPLLSDPVAEVRLSAILAIEHCPEPRALELLLALLEDPEESVRDFARQYGFACLGAPAVPALLDRLHDARDFVRAGAARALSMPSRRSFAGEPDWVQARYPYALSDDMLLEVLQALTHALGDADPSVRYQAIRALEAHGDSRTVPALLDVLVAEEDEGNRATIANYLRQCNAGPLLDQQIADPDRTVSARAATGLSYFIWSMLKDHQDVSAPG
jgi:HEAT repeat protein